MYPAGTSVFRLALRFSRTSRYSKILHLAKQTYDIAQKLSAQRLPMASCRHIGHGGYRGALSNVSGSEVRVEGRYLRDAHVPGLRMLQSLLHESLLLLDPARFSKLLTTAVAENLHKIPPVKI
jgi:hypothetical protein